MKKWFKHVLVAGVVATFAFSIPNVVTKYKTETSSQTVELAVDYKQVYSNAKKGDEKFENQILNTLHNSGVNSIGLTENSLSELETRDLVHVMSGSELERDLWSQDYNVPINKNYTYVLVPKEEKQQEIIKTIQKSHLGNTVSFKIKDTSVVQINKRKADVYKLPILYLESDYKNLHKLYSVVPRISNKWDERLPLIEKQLETWNKKDNLSSVVFLGDEAEGYSEDEEGIPSVHIHRIWEKLGIGIVESFSSEDRQKGVRDYAVISNYNIIRVHSLPKEKLEKMSPIEMKRLVAKATKERNIRMIYLNPFYLKADEKQKDYNERLSTSVQNIHDTIEKSGFKIGQAKPFVQKGSPFLSKFGIVTSLLGVVYLLCLALYTAFKSKENPALNKLFPMAIASGTAAILFGYLAGTNLMIIKIASLGLSVLLPVWASLHVYFTLDKKDEKKLNIIKDILGPIAALYIVGLSYLISMNHGVEHVTYIETFKGVSLTLSVPPVLVALFLIINIGKDISLKKVLVHKIRVIDVLVIAFLGAFFVFYESRSGNGGTLLPFETMLRGWLEDTLPWRPRTKEIFFAFPLLMIMIGMWNVTKWARLALPFVAVGFASLFNTFTHFHTPMVASAGRSVISVSFGLVIGLVIVIILRTVLEVFGKTNK